MYSMRCSMKKVVYLSIVGLTFTMNAFAAQQQDVYQFIGGLHFPSLAKKEQVEIKIAEEVAQHNKEIEEKKPSFFSGRKDLSKVKDAPIGEVEQLKLFNQMFSNGVEKSFEEITGSLLTDTTCGDLDLLCGGKPEFEKSLLAKINHTKTAGGRLQLARMLVEPKSSIEELRNRQEMIKILVQNPDLLRTIDEKLDVMKGAETDVIWFTKQLEEAVLKLYDQAYFGKFLGLNALNKKEIPMEIAALWTLYGAPIRSFFWPAEYYMWWITFSALFTSMIVGSFEPMNVLARAHWEGTKGFFRVLFNGELLPVVRRAFAEGCQAWWDAPFNVKSATVLGGGLLGGVYVWPIIAVCKEAKKFNTISKAIQKRMLGVATYFTTLRELGQMLSNTDALFASSSEGKLATNLRARTADGTALLAEFDAGCFKGQPRLLTRKGKVLAAFKKMFDEANGFVDLMLAAGKLDAYASIAKLFNKQAKHGKAQYCFVDFVEREKPVIRLADFWHPALNPAIVVANSIDIGCNDNPLNMILTGPNMGGKSTALKAIVLSVIFAQTFTIAPAREMQLTPFSLINTYLNIADTVGKESLYQAEMMRTKKLLRAIDDLGRDQKSFVIMDEMFTGTNAQEGMAAAYGVATKMSHYKRNVTLLATHFYALTDLEHDIPGCYKNYKVSITKDADGTIKFPYRLEPGVADQSIALELLATEGFDKEILEAAKFAADNKLANAMAHKEAVAKPSAHNVTAQAAVNDVIEV